jgi:hypothetical protein
MAGSKKAAGVRILFKPSVPGFPAAVDPHEHPPPDLAAHHVATLLIDVVVLLPPFGRLDVRILVDDDRAPYPSDTFRLSTASSYTLNPPFVRPYPPLHHIVLKIQAPPPPNGTVSSQ